MSPNKRQRTILGTSASGSADTEIIRRVMRSDDPIRNQLLWDIPNDVTLSHIAPRWSWETRQVVAEVSRDWQRVFQEGMVYDPQVPSPSRDTFFVVLSHFSTAFGPEYVDGYGKTRSIFSEKWIFSLFSPRERRWYKLPPVPGCHSGMPSGCQRVILDGAIYLLGGTRSGKKHIPSTEKQILNLAAVHTLEWKQYLPSEEVHVLDLAGGYPLEWRRCADMLVPRLAFTIGVMQGKIFVFGGESEGTYSEVRNEVYDPKVDAWSWIAPNIPSVIIKEAFSVGQAFFVCWGRMANNLPGIPAASGQRRKQPGPPAAWMKPVSGYLADIRGDTKLVITGDSNGVLRLISTRDDAAEDMMDDLHEIIEIRLDGLGNGVAAQPSPAETLESYIEHHDQHLCPKFLGILDPVKDEWRVFEVESLGTHDVDTVEPTHVLDLGAAGYGAADATAEVWAVSL